MQVNKSSLLRDYQLDGLKRALESTGNPVIKIYSGTIPDNTGAITTQTLLATITLSNPVGVITDGVLKIFSTTPVLISATGTATWARISNAGSGVVLDCDVTDNTGDGVIKLNTTSLVANQYILLEAQQFGVT